MPLSTLNKVVSLVVSGGLVLSLGILRWWTWLTTNFQFDIDKLKNLAGFVAVGAVFMLLPLVVFLGVVCDALTALLVRHLLRGVSESEKWCRRLWLRREYEHLNRWASLFRNALTAKKTYPLDDADSDGRKGLAVGLALRSSAREFDYALEHYAAYVIAGNFMIVVIAVFISNVFDEFFGAVGTIRFWSVLVGSPVILGLLLIYAIQKYCYAHEMAYRSGFITLWAPVQSKESEGNKESEGSRESDVKGGLRDTEAERSEGS